MNSVSGTLCIMLRYWIWTGIGIGTLISVVALNWQNSSPRPLTAQLSSCVGNSVSVDVTNGNVNDFGNCPAGIYRIKHTGGCVNVWGCGNAGPGGKGWQARATIVHSGGSGESNFYGGGYFSSENECVSTVIEPGRGEKSVTHNGGSIGMRFDDTPYTDNCPTTMEYMIIDYDPCIDDDDDGVCNDDDVCSGFDDALQECSGGDHCTNCQCDGTAIPDSNGGCTFCDNGQFDQGKESCEGGSHCNQFCQCPNSLIPDDDGGCTCPPSRPFIETTINGPSCHACLTADDCPAATNVCREAVCEMGDSGYQECGLQSVCSEDEHCTEYDDPEDIVGWNDLTTTEADYVCSLCPSPATQQYCGTNEDGDAVCCAQTAACIVPNPPAECADDKDEALEKCNTDKTTCSNDCNNCDTPQCFSDCRDDCAKKYTDCLEAASNEFSDCVDDKGGNYACRAFGGGGGSNPPPAMCAEPEKWGLVGCWFEMVCNQNIFPCDDGDQCTQDICMAGAVDHGQCENRPWVVPIQGCSGGGPGGPGPGGSNGSGGSRGNSNQSPSRNSTSTISESVSSTTSLSDAVTSTSVPVSSAIPSVSSTISSAISVISNTSFSSEQNSSEFQICCDDNTFCNPFGSCDDPYTDLDACLAECGASSSSQSSTFSSAIESTSSTEVSFSSTESSNSSVFSSEIAFEFHYTCIDQACTRVLEAGEDTCSDDSDCLTTSSVSSFSIESSAQSTGNSDMSVSSTNSSGNSTTSTTNSADSSETSTPASVASSTPSSTESSADNSTTSLQESSSTSVIITLSIPSSSSTDTTPTTFCGDGIMQPGEQCEQGVNLCATGRTCEQSTCTCVPIAAQPLCGNGVFDLGEQCERGIDLCAIGRTCNPNICTCMLDPNPSSTSSQPIIIASNQCGNGRIDPREQCDDGNTRNGDRCSATCTINSENLQEPLRCGDGLLTVGEECDDGNVRSGDGCSDQCTIEERLVAAAAVCGNGILEPPEECDDSNRRDNDGCSSTCLLEVGICGDGKVQSLLGEQCEQGQDLPQGVICTQCRYVSQTCGDGSVDPGEECDDGNQNSTSPDALCRPDCSLGRCGDGILDTTELCDDGNRLSNDGCDRFCRTEDTQIASDVTENQQASAPINIVFNPLQPSQQINFPNQPTVQQLPFQLPLAQLQPFINQQGPAGDTGPAAVAVIATGAAAGFGLVRRKKRK